MSELVLYGHPESGHACKVALALGLAGLAHRPVRIDIWAEPQTRPAAFLAASPLAEVPLLVIDGTPHMQAIFAAYNRHQIACATPTVQTTSAAEYSWPAT